MFEARTGRSRRVSGWMLAFAISSSACNPDAVPTATPRAFVNKCDTIADCGADEICIQDVCYATSPTQLDIVFEVIPGPLSSVGSNQSFLVEAHLLSQPKQLFDIVLPSAAQVSYQVSLAGRSLKDPDPPGNKSTCAWHATKQLKSVAMHASLFPSRRAPGLPASPIAFGPVPAYFGSDIVAWNLSSTLPPGVFNVYLEPTDDAECEIPPVLLRNQDPQKNPSRNIGIAVTPNTSFQGTIRTRLGLSLEGWRVEVIDPTTGLRISTHGTVGAPTEVPESGAEYNSSPFGATVTTALGTTLYPLEYMILPSDGPVIPDDPTFRLKPPAGYEGAAPSFSWSIPRVLDINNTNTADIDLRTVALSDVKVGAQIEAIGSAIPTRGVMWLRSLPGGLLGFDPGLPASFTTRTATSSSDDRFHVTLLPGMYEGLVVPDEQPGSGSTGSVSADAGAGDRPGLARKRFQWKVGTTPVQEGRVEELSDLTEIEIQVVHGKKSEPAASLAVTAWPSASMTSSSDPIDDLLPRRSSAFTDGMGLARLQIDAESPSNGASGSGGPSSESGNARFDIVARCDPESEYAWKVLRSVKLPSDAPATLQLRAPFSVEGRVLASSSDGTSIPIQGGRIRVYARPPNRAVPYVQIGETTFSQGKGAAGTANAIPGYFRLLLPPSL